MRLFQMLMRRKGMPNGDIYRGKKRLVKPVNWSDTSKLKNEFAIEEKNMFYLRHAFLTPEQSDGHAKALGKHEKRMLELKTRPKKFKENVTIEARLGHVRYNEPWD